MNNPNTEAHTAYQRGLEDGRIEGREVMREEAMLACRRRNSMFELESDEHTTRRNEALACARAIKVIP